MFLSGGVRPSRVLGYESIALPGHSDGAEHIGQTRETLGRYTMNAQLQPEPYTDFRLLINGRLVEGASTFDVINPATERVLAVCPKADVAQLDQAVAAAKAAFPAWSATPIEERRRLILKLADALAARTDEFARLLTQEQGKPLAMAQGELFGSVAMIQAFAAMDLSDKVLKEDATQRIVQRRAPLGVVAAITPWNFPMILLMIKIPPALLAGNTVVAKPAPTTPLTTLRFGELCAEIFPPGVVNVITDQNDLGGALTGHPDVAKVAFTGSTATGKKVMASVAGTLKRLTLELGGNDAAIVLDDVDPKEVAPKIFNAAMVNTGQVCLAAKRVYVHDSMYDAVCTELAKLADATVVGNGLDPDTQLGPLQNKTQFEKVQGYIADGRARGKIIAGGTRARRTRVFHPSHDRSRYPGRCAAGTGGAVRPGSPGAALFGRRRRDPAREQHRLRARRHRLVVKHGTGLRGRDAGSTRAPCG